MSGEGDKDPVLNMGIMTESKGSGALRLQAMVDHRLTCIAKNYSLDEETKAGLNQTDRAATMSFDAPNDPLQPVFISKSGPAVVGSAAGLLDDGDSDDEPTGRKL